MVSNKLAPRFVKRLVRIIRSNRSKRTKLTKIQTTSNLISELFREISARTENDKLREFASVMAERSKTGHIFVSLSDFMPGRNPTQADVEKLYEHSDRIRR